VRRLPVVLLMISLVLVGALGCGPSPREEQEARVDEAIHEIEHAISAFYLLGPDASADRIRSATSALSAAWKELVAAAQGLEGVQLDEAASAHDALVSTVDTLPSDGATKPMDSVISQVEAFKAAIEEVHTGGDFH